jgi:hypothetical protein
MKKGGSMKLTPFCLKSFAVTTFTEREHQAIELVDHTHHATLLFANLTAPVFSFNWLRRESHQTPIEIKLIVMLYESPDGFCRPRETLVPRRVQLVVTFNVAVIISTPVLKWLTAWAIQCCTKQMAQRRCPIIRSGLTPVR